MNSAGINYCGLLFLKDFAEETFAKKAKNCKRLLPFAAYKRGILPYRDETFYI